MGPRGVFGCWCCQTRCPAAVAVYLHRAACNCLPPDSLGGACFFTMLAHEPPAPPPPPPARVCAGNVSAQQRAWFLPQHACCWWLPRCAAAGGCWWVLLLDARGRHHSAALANPMTLDSPGTADGARNGQPTCSLRLDRGSTLWSRWWLLLCSSPGWPAIARQISEYKTKNTCTPLAGCCRGCWLQQPGCSPSSAPACRCRATPTTICWCAVCGPVCSIAPGGHELPLARGGLPNECCL